MRQFNNSSYYQLSNFCKSKESKENISFEWMLGVTQYKHTADSVTGKNIGQYRPFLWNAKLHKAIDMRTYLTAIRNKKRCAEYIKKFEEWGLPLDLDFGDECKLK